MNFRRHQQCQPDPWYKDCAAELGKSRKDSVDLIRDSLFSIQVKQPWLLLQYGNSDVESIGADRVEHLLSTSPDENNGQDREEIVVEEIEDRENTNLTITKTINRLGTVFFLFMFNIGISVLYSCSQG